jgi:hypothetical protein
MTAEPHSFPNGRPVGEYVADQRSQTDRIERLVTRLESLHGGVDATFALIECGWSAVPALRRVLYERDPSGIFEARCRAVKALAGIGARAVLLEFLGANHGEADPVVRLGEEAVVNVVARALIGFHTKEFYELLTRMAEHQLLSGVVEALADFRRCEAIPILVAALAEDFSRAAAEEGLRKLGSSAREALIEAATSQDPSPEWESPSSLRRRRSAVQLLLEIGTDFSDWPRLQHLPNTNDPMLAFLACKLRLSGSDAKDKAGIIRRLISLLPSADWFLAGEIEDCLVQNFPAAREFVDRALKNSGNPSGKSPGDIRLFRTLKRVKARAEVST